MTFMCEYNVRKGITIWDTYFKPNKPNKRKNSKYSKINNELQPTHSYVLNIQGSKTKQQFLRTSTSTTTKRTTNPPIITTTLLDLLIDSSDQQSDNDIDKGSDGTAWAIVEILKTIFLAALN